MAQDKHSLTGISDSGNHVSIFKKNKRLFLASFAALFLVATIVAVATGVSSHKNSKNEGAHAIVKSSCSSTLYPELCYSAIATAPAGVTSNLASLKDVIELSINLTTKAVQHNYFTVEKLTGNTKLTEREKTALHDCLETIDETLDELHEAQADINGYPNKKSLKQQADDLKTLLSSAITNQETCLDGFSHDGADKKVRKALLKGQKHVEKMCSNALAMIRNMTDTDIATELLRNTNRKLKEEKDGSESVWPEWMSAADRRLLQSSSVTPNVVVAADGSGDYKTVSEAVAAAPKKSSKRYIIRIKAGVYRENVDVPKDKHNIVFLGDGRKTTIITASRNVVDGSTTFKSATVAAVGQGFLARGVTFQNTAGSSKHQAVALRVGSDLSAFYECDMLAYQDTLYVHSNRQFFINCLVAGTVDFIFGNAAVVFQDCDIHARRPDSGQKNMVTAQGRTDPNQNTGIVIQKSRIGATSDLLPVKSSFPTYLGRPWKEYSRTVIMQSSISDVINPAGWHEWSGSFALSTLFYAEYQNSGAGAGTSSRVTWAGYKVITSASEAQVFTPGNFIAGSSWLSSTTFPFSLGLPIDKHKNRSPLKADVVVAAEGSGDYSTVSAAVDAAQREAVRGALSESKQVFTGKLCKY
ncbi:PECTINESTERASE [Salix viminalis]|uniref:Pectinesterase n=1 Tax=Salix viminalis TaxID=40686 RepID=A0A9Q0YYW4_SALVM|nr:PECTINESTERASE [Salix viminalis]